MRNQQKIIFHTVCFPIACRFAVMLFLNDNLFQLESCTFKDLHYIKGQRNHVTFSACISHQNCTEFFLFSELGSTRRLPGSFLSKILYVQPRQVPINVFAISNNICIWRMGTNQINALILYKGRFRASPLFRYTRPSAPSCSKFIFSLHLSNATSLISTPIISLFSNFASTSVVPPPAN